MGSAPDENGASPSHGVFGRAGALDGALYGAVARTRRSPLDGPIALLSNAANGGGLWFVLAGAAALGGGPRGRRSAVRALVALGVGSAVANLVVKPAVSRQRPERDTARRGPSVTMPGSSSFPSGHTATAFGFVASLAADYPALTAPLLALAAIVGYSRVHTGVHYPADVLVGAAVGYGAGRATRSVILRAGPSWLREPV
jgi:membrane-associated phospholipid phosphatase